MALPEFYVTHLRGCGQAPARAQNSGTHHAVNTHHSRTSLAPLQRANINLKIFATKLNSPRNWASDFFLSAWSEFFRKSFPNLSVSERIVRWTCVFKFRILLDVLDSGFWCKYFCTFFLRFGKPLPCFLFWNMNDLWL